MPEIVSFGRGAADAQPFLPEAEQLVIGSALIHPDLVPVIMGAGGQALFWEPVHVAIAGVMMEKHRAGELVSPVTVWNAMKSHEGLLSIGGGAYLARMAGAATASAFNAVLRDLADARDKRIIGEALARASGDIARGEGTAAQIAHQLEASLMAISRTEEDAPVSMLKAVTGAVRQAKAAFEGDDTGAVASGIYALDRIVSGFYPGELVLLGGRPSMGKTGVALACAINAARAGHGVCIVSLEMTPEAMALRALAEQTAQQRTPVSYAAMRRGDMTDAQVASLQQAASIVSDLPIAFLPRAYSDIDAMLAGVKRIRATQPSLRLVIVDYAQLLQSDARSRYEQITAISIALKRMAMQMDLPVIALSQLSRAVEQREDKRPMLADLRESGQLEQDADTVLFCYRDEYYLERMKPAPEEPEDVHQEWRMAFERARNRLEIIVAKQRQGEIGTAHCRFNPAINLVWEDGRI